MANPLYDALFAAGAPDAPALFSEGGAITYSELAAQSARLAASFAHAGVASGDRVVAQIGKSAAGLAAWLAAVRAGAVWVPLNPAYTDAELAYFLADAEPSLVLTDPDRLGATRALAACPVETLEGLATPSEIPPAARDAEYLAAIVYTSGTTGRPKGAMLSQRSLLTNAGALKDVWRFTERDVLVHALPLFHVHGLFIAPHVIMLAGGAMILQPRFDPAAVVAALPRATSLMGVPTFYHRLLAEPGLAEAARGVRLFVSGSAPLPAALHHRWREATGHVILERYGMSETGMNASNPYDSERRAGTVGFPLPGVEIRIVGDDGAPLPPGEAGMIEVKGPNLFSGYWRRPEATREAFRPDGYFVTGDLGVFSADGYLSIAGRARDLVISGGLNVYPAEVEAALEAIAGVSEAAVIGLPHRDLGEAVTAVVVAGPGAELDEEGVRAALAPSLARFKQPKRVLFAPELPKNAMGKVTKAQLREHLSGLYGDAGLD